MTPAEIAAYIGALAWLPQIWSWIYGKIIKPKLRISCAPTGEVGYSTFGPIVNIDVSISTEKRDALIEKISLKVTHEKGEVRTLTWTTLGETPQEVRSATGEVTSRYTRTQPATALRVGEYFSADKLVGFREAEYGRKYTKLTNDLEEHYQHLKKNQTEDRIKAVMGSTEFRDLSHFFENNMYWKEGNYTLEFSLEEVHLKEPHTETFTMRLAKTDIDILRRNLANLQSTMEIAVATIEGLEEIPEHKTTWNWIYPEINRQK